MKEYNPPKVFTRTLEFVSIKPKLDQMEQDWSGYHELTYLFMKQDLFMELYREVVGFY